MLKNTRIVSAFPACGKTWLYKNQDELGLQVADSDSSLYSWVTLNKVKQRNPDFPSNYINHINRLIGTVDYILVSSHDEVRKALTANGLRYVLVMPSMALQDEWIHRCAERGSPEGFLSLLRTNWVNWVDASQFIHEDVIILSSGEYLADKIDLLTQI